MTRAGRLRYPAVIQSPTITVDTMGGPVKTWGTHLKTWIALAPANSRWREYYAAMAETAEGYGVAEMRYQPDHGIDPTMRIYVDGRYLQIVWVRDPDGRRRDLHLLYREVSP